MRRNPIPPLKRSVLREDKIELPERRVLSEGMKKFYFKYFCDESRGASVTKVELESFIRQYGDGLTAQNFRLHLGKCLAEGMALPEIGRDFLVLSIIYAQPRERLEHLRSYRTRLLDQGVSRLELVSVFQRLEVLVQGIDSELDRDVSRILRNKFLTMISDGEEIHTLEQFYVFMRQTLVLISKQADTSLRKKLFHRFIDLVGSTSDAKYAESEMEVLIVQQSIFAASRVAAQAASQTIHVSRPPASAALVSARPAPLPSTGRSLKKIIEEMKRSVDYMQNAINNRNDSSKS